MSIISIVFLPYFTVISSKFILQTMVDERYSKMKETMKIMSLTDFAYGTSTFIYQVFMCLLHGLVFSLFFFHAEYIFPTDEKHVTGKTTLFLVVLVLFSIGQSAVAMALSTIF